MEALYTLSSEVQQLILRSKIPDDIDRALHEAWEKLEAEASKLGMVYPEPGAVVILDGRPAADSAGRGWLARLFRINKAS